MDLNTAPSEKQQSEVLVRRMMEDLERKVQDWKRTVFEQREQIKNEWSQLESEKLALRARTALLNETAEEMTTGLKELAAMRQDLERRLAVTPMDLTAEELQQEWALIDKEKQALQKSQEMVERSIKRLQEAEAAMELVM